MGSNLELPSSLSTSFSLVPISYVPRSCNKVAHALADLGCKYPQGAHLRWKGTLTQSRIWWPAIAAFLKY